MKLIFNQLNRVLFEEFGHTKAFYKLIQIIKSQHSEPHRFYHTLDHLETMLDYFSKFENKIESKNTMVMAILFHDIIYDVQKSDNEKKSADFMEKTLSNLGFSSTLIRQCYTFILASSGHQIHTNKDINYFLDFDLNILGQSWDKYENYTRQIRLEYNIYPDDLYIPGRIKILEHFLTFDSIYKTDFFKNNYENMARQNLLKEIEWLKDKALLL